VTDPRTLVTHYVNDGFGEIVQQVSPDTGTTTNTYDSAGNLKTTTDARGAVGTYTYDAMNRPTQVQFVGPTEPTVTKAFTYDTCTYGKGRLCQRTDQAGVTNWTYTAQGRIASRTEIDNILPDAPPSSPNGTYVLNYAYNAYGQRTSLQLPSGSTVSYTYNGNNQISGMSVTVNGVVTPILSQVMYEPFGAVKGWTWGNGAPVIRSHNQDGNVSAISSTGLHLSFGYDSAQRLTSVTDLDSSAFSWTYGYDGLDRLTSANDASVTESWTYDANGNRLTQTGGVLPGSFTYETTSNRFQSQNAHNPSHSYDTAGNPLDFYGPPVQYDAEGNVSSGPMTYYTNGARQRAYYDVGGGEQERLVYDDEGHVLGQYLWDPLATLGSPLDLQQETIWLGDLPIAALMSLYTYDTNGNFTGTQEVLYYVHADHLNTPRRLTRPADNAVIYRWDSDPFGYGYPNENPGGGSVWIAYSLRFPGQVYEPNFGTYYNWHRDYDSTSGRYIQSDPLGLAGGSNSTYGYADGDPVTNQDPTGQFVFPAPAVPVATGTIAAPIAAVAAAGIAGYAFGTAIYDASSTQIQDAIDWALNAHQVDWVDQQNIEREANRREYKNRCSEPPPPNLNPCELAKWKLKRAQDCKALRNANTARWWGGTDTQHDPQLSRDLDSAISNAEKAVARACKCQ
jgi:RHS repeat-associated protein